MRPAAGLCVLLSLFAGSATLAVASERQLGAHQHGHGTVNLVIDGPTVWIELEAPGSDIVGFEHAAESAGDRTAVEAATTLLEQPLELFTLSSDAGCSVETVAVALAGQDSGGGKGHSEFHAEYTINCADPKRIDTVGFAYFSHFPAAQELDVNVISGAGQSRYEVERDDPEIRLEGK